MGNYYSHQIMRIVVFLHGFALEIPLCEIYSHHA